jgi:superfamily I DNA and/or RNA helicase
VLVVVKVTVVVGDNKQTKQTNTFFLFLSSALFTFF